MFRSSLGRVSSKVKIKAKIKATIKVTIKATISIPCKLNQTSGLFNLRGFRRGLSEGGGLIETGDLIKLSSISDLILRRLSHELYPTNHHLSQEHAIYSTPWLLLPFCILQLAIFLPLLGLCIGHHGLSSTSLI